MIITKREALQNQWWVTKHSQKNITLTVVYRTNQSPCTYRKPTLLYLYKYCVQMCTRGSFERRRRNSRARLTMLQNQEHTQISHTHTHIIDTCRRHTREECLHGFSFGRRDKRARRVCLCAHIIIYCMHCKYVHK